MGIRLVQLGCILGPWGREHRAFAGGSYLDSPDTLRSCWMDNPDAKRRLPKHSASDGSVGSMPDRYGTVDQRWRGGGGGGAAQKRQRPLSSGS